MQNTTFTHPKFPTRGKLLDFFIKALEIENEYSDDRKRYQRFIGEVNIGVDEYSETLDIYIYAIVKELIFDDSKKKSAKKTIDDFLTMYLELTRKVEIYPYTQKCITYILIKYIYLPFLNFFYKYYIDIDINIFLNSNKSALDTFFEMVRTQMNMGEEELKDYLFDKLDAITDKSKSDHTLKISIDNWLNNKVFPNRKNIKHLAKILFHDLTESEQQLRQYLIAAKLIDTSKIFEQFTFDENLNIVSVDKFDKLVQDYCESQFANIHSLASELFMLNRISEEKTDEMISKFNFVCKKLDEQGVNEKNLPHIAWSKARFHAQKKEFKEATNYYLLALENGKNSMGEHYVEIIKEGLIISAQITGMDTLTLKTAQSPFVKFYKEAYFSKSIDALPDEINQYFLNDMKKKFHTYFNYLYPNIERNCVEQVARDHGIVSMDDLVKIKLDLKKPDKWIKNKYPNPMTQLMHFSGFADYEKVKKLLDAGADANSMRFNDNGTALTMVLSNEQNDNKKRHNAIKIAKLLISKMSEEALCAKLPKKQITALGLAIDRGYIEVVQALISKGVDINQIISLDEVSPLYYTVQKIGIPKIDFSMIRKNMNLCTDSDILKIVNSMPSYIPFFNHVITDKEKIQAFKSLQQESHQWKNIIYNVAERLLKQEQNNTETYYQIFNLLLKAKPDLEIKQVTYGHTVLMVSTELDETNIVKKLLHAGAKKEATIDDIYNPNIKYTAKAFAERNGNQELINML